VFAHVACTLTSFQAGELVTLRSCKLPGQQACRATPAKNYSSHNYWIRVIHFHQGADQLQHLLPTPACLLLLHTYRGLQRMEELVAAQEALYAQGMVPGLPSDTTIDESSELSEVSVQGLAGVLDGVGSLPVSASDSEEWEDVA
jgi:hypothetical protein